MISQDAWAALRGELRFGQRLTGTVVGVPRPGMIGVFVDVGLPVGGFVDVVFLARAEERWPVEGTVAEFEVWWADPDRQQIRLKPADPTHLRDDFAEFAAEFMPSRLSFVGLPIDHVEKAMDVLRREFAAQEGSFLLALRCELTWDRAAFTRLERAMRVACAYWQSSDKVDRWLADGFYEMATAVPSWTAHPDFPRPTPDTYYEACLERIGDLADWFFRGESSYLEGHVWQDL
ncbi:hypothetical protein ACFWZ2_19530 [Streptomyces sp. NPDC059002]|uniref:hypothetical protein n=1 Tax=Streptomyces sp. NPDC059002 TaxID=3346690 RepID=UPI0036AB1311